MTWFKTCDDFPDNRKTRSLHRGPCRGDCVALWLFAGCWSSKNLEDGFVPDDVVPSFGFHGEAPSELVRVGLWKRADKAGQTGYRFHDWSDYQPSSERVEEKRRAGAERKAKTRARLSAAKKESTVEVVVDDCLARGVANINDASRVPRACLAPASLSPRAGLADASRERERETQISSSTSEVNSSTSPTTSTSLGKVVELNDWVSTSSQGRDPIYDGYGWVENLLKGGAHPPLFSAEKEYRWIGQQSAADLQTVGNNVRATRWCAEKPGEVSPKHLVLHWKSYLSGPRNFDFIPKGPAKRSGPAAVSSPEEFMRDAAAAVDF
jgi:hypothetical protein